MLFLGADLALIKNICQAEFLIEQVGRPRDHSGIGHDSSKCRLNSAFSLGFLAGQALAGLFEFNGHPHPFLLLLPDGV